MTNAKLERLAKEAKDATDKRLRMMLLTPDLPGEEWKTILVPSDCRDWSISNLGRIRSRATGRIVRTANDSNGRLMVRLGRRAIGVQVKALMVAHWMPPKPSDDCVAVYQSNDFTDNSLDNLRWITKTELAAKLAAARATRPPTTLAAAIIREYERTGSKSETARATGSNLAYVKDVLKRSAKLKATNV